MVLADMKLAADTPTDVVLFNIDSKSEQTGKQSKDAIVTVFLKVFNEMQGFYGSMPYVADLERQLSEDGRYNEFKQEFAAATGKSWEDSRRKFDFIQDDIVDVLVDMDYMSEPAARNWCEKAAEPYQISIENFARMVREYIEKKGHNHHVCFLVDEVGQYIGDDSRLMLNLQTIREAVEEIAAMIRRIAGSANTLHFIVTADHGFLYKRHALAESDKIPNTAPKTAFVNRRFIVDADPIAQPGVASLPMATVLNTKTNTLTVSYPTAANVFKVAGGGENYVHGGSSPQEMIVPVLDVRMEKGRMETTTVQLTLVSILKKITNLITALDFMQNEPISDTVRETTFRVYFVGEDNERISNENIVVADKRGETAAERMFRLRFSFKNQKYDNKKPYYLVAYDDKNSVEVLRRQVVMDIAMADDFGFGF